MNGPKSAAHENLSFSCLLSPSNEVLDFVQSGGISDDHDPHRSSHAESRRSGSARASGRLGRFTSVERGRYLTARDKIATGSLVCGFVAFAAAYLGLEGLGVEGNFASIPAVILGIGVGAGLWLRARTTGALYM